MKPAHTPLPPAIATVALALALLPCASCRYPTPEAGLLVSNCPRDNLRVESSWVARRLRVTDVKTVRRNNLLQGQATVYNTQRTGLAFEYRFRWLDANGMEVPAANTLWTPVSISARERRQLQAMAPAGEATCFDIDIRFSQPSTRW